MNLRITFLLLALGLSTYSQVNIKLDGKNCPMEGDAEEEQEQKQNPFKNRYKLPKKSDIDESITLEYLLNAKKNDPKLSQDMAVKVTGYVSVVKYGSIETCNCHAKKVAFQDTHIELLLSKKVRNKKKHIVIEVTPRLRKMMLEEGVDWSTSELKSEYLGKMVTFTGWLFFDGSHEDESFADDPINKKGRKNKRATCWELHPVTEITIAN